MTPSQTLILASSLLGAVGSLMVIFGSHALEPYEGATWGSDETVTHNAQIRERNRVRLLSQRVGLGFILVAFLFQGVSAFAPA